MTVFQRTPDGQWAAYSADSPLPRKLKILLKAINGGATDEVYAQSLSAFGDVPALLQSLERAGLIEDTRRRRQATSNSPAAIASKIRALETPVSIWERTVVCSGPAPAPEFLATSPAPAAQPTPTPAPQAPLQQAIDCMSNFVLVHLPESAFQVLPEIEALASLEELGVLLGGYAQFVAGAGDAAQDHLAGLQALLEAADAAQPA